jgi:hypothetical protein
MTSPCQTWSTGSGSVLVHVITMLVVPVAIVNVIVIVLNSLVPVTGQMFMVVGGMPFAHRDSFLRVILMFL